MLAVSSKPENRNGALVTSFEELAKRAGKILPGKYYYRENGEIRETGLIQSVHVSKFGIHLTCTGVRTERSAGDGAPLVRDNAWLIDRGSKIENSTDDAIAITHSSGIIKIGKAKYEVPGFPPLQLPFGLTMLPSAPKGISSIAQNTRGY